ncbi:complement C3-like [Colossoma macropomum]|uniref:complement C3-like n=1 Tax=Colossoma macropomum TaxID=42526 RepID=UPI001864D854|nr:complement C3-like [Colossoma macropomum]
MCINKVVVVIQSQLFRHRQDQTGRMGQVDLLWITAALLSSPLLTLCDPLYIISAPQIMKVGTEERVFVEVQDYKAQKPLNVNIQVMNFPTQDVVLYSSTVTLKPEEKFQALVGVNIPFNGIIFDTDPKKNQYVYLKATFDGRHSMEKIVMVSFQPGYIFIHIDKTVYTPDSTVQYKLFPLGTDAKLVSLPLVVEIVTPEGIIVSTNRMYASLEGYRPERFVGWYKPESTGTWKIVASLRNYPHKKFTAEFEVRDYVLPSFEVKLTPERSFFYTGDETLSVEIKAMYLFGQEVQGSAFAVFGLLNEGNKINLQSSLARVDIVNGQGTAVLRRDHILQTFPNIDELVGKTLYVSVSVLTESGSEMVEAERRGIHIVKAPYTIHFTRTPKYFKPGIPYDFKVYITNPDETPAENVQISVTPDNVKGKTDKNGIANIVINTLKGASSLDITVRTLMKGIPAENKMTVHAYKPRGGSQNYLHIDRITGLLKVRGSFYPKADDGILSKGRIVTASRYQTSGNSVIAVPLEVTKEMLPSFRVVAYYHVGSSEVVADSIWVDVQDTCMGSLKVDVEDVKAAYTPNEVIDLKITGDPEAKVDLVALDKSVYVNNKNRLTQTKIWDTFEKHDLACTAGSGKDSMGVFYDAGLLFMSNSAGSTPDRRDFSCPSEPSRKRRYVTTDTLGEEEVDDEELDVISRLIFPERWLWQSQMLPNCKDKGKCETTLRVWLPEQITTWVITAISTSTDYGICVADPVELRVQKLFFVDMKLPYSAVVNEQIEINAIIHNFRSSQIDQVIVELKETKSICSLASYKKKYRTIVSIAGKSSRAVPFVIIPLVPGQYYIEVMVKDPDAWKDGVREKLEVVLPARGALTGVGEGSMAVVTGHHTKPYPVGVKCKNFDLDVTFSKMETISYDGALVSYTLSIETKFLKDRESTMTVLDISLLTGFIPDNRDLQKLMGTDRHIQRFEMDKLSDRGSLIIYLKKVSNVVKERITFRMHKKLHVRLLQPARITVYEYNDKENHCVKFYDAAERINGMLRTICPTDVCSCAEMNCDLLKDPEVPAEDKRTEEACQKDFVYKATLKDIKRSGLEDIYTFSVDVLKEGSDPVQPQDQRNFWAHSQCKDKLNLKVGKDYLIMGPEPKKIEDSYHYLFGVWTWLEYWPTTRESHENKNNNRERYNGLESLKYYLHYTGCPT